MCSCLIKILSRVSQTDYINISDYINNSMTTELNLVRNLNKTWPRPGRIDLYWTELGSEIDPPFDQPRFDIILFLRYTHIKY